MVTINTRKALTIITTLSHRQLAAVHSAPKSSNKKHTKRTMTTLEETQLP